jgi:predicted O-linked N-acetylglucosamine transferase (SPINDLY family)
MDLSNTTHDANVQKMYEGIHLLEINEIDQSYQCFQALLQQGYESPVIYYYLSKIEAQRNRFEDSISFINKAIAINSSTPEFYLAKSIINMNMGSLNESLHNAKLALSFNPSYIDAQTQFNTLNDLMNPGTGILQEINSLNSIALNLQAQNKYLEAEKLFFKVLEHDSSNFIALYSLGMLHIHQNDPICAIQYFDVLQTKTPNHELVLFALGTCYKNIGQFKKAIDYYDLNISINPSYMNSYHNKAAIQQQLNQHKDALLTLVQATTVNPNDFQSLEGQGILLSQYKEYSKAAEVFKNLYDRNPSYPYIQGNLLNARLHNCDWSDFKDLTHEIEQGIHEGLPVTNPLTLMTFCTSADKALTCARNFGLHKYPPSSITLYNGENYKHLKKKIAFISGDFREHPVGYLIIGVIESFDKDLYEITGIFTGNPDKSTVWQRFCCTFDNFLNCATKTDLEIAQLIRSLEIDYLIDLSGYTADTRLSVLSYRPAPVQMTYLGFPGTLGLPYVDYIIGDRITIPDNLFNSYSEQPLQLNFNYLPRDTSVTPSDKCYTRNDFDLPTDAVVFCCFNHLYKITPSIFSVWMRLLDEVKGSVLWLMQQNNLESKENLLKAASALGVDPSRIIFATRLPDIRDHLKRFGLADIFLDTFPYNGHTTCSDALFSGLPVVTLYSDTFASRVCFSLLNDLGLEILAANTIEDYYSKVKFLALNQNELNEIKYQLNKRVEKNIWPIRSTLFSSNLAKIIMDL